jgi:hypothetical protein
MPLPPVRILILVVPVASRGGMHDAMHAARVRSTAGLIGAGLRAGP